MRDPLGNTVVLLDNTQTQTDTFTYWPYGEVNTRTGTTATPFQFVGTLGYFLDAASALSYVRARHLFTSLARWLTVDPLWPREAPYVYGIDSPVTTADPTGTASARGIQPPPGPPPPPNADCAVINQYVFQYCNACYEASVGSAFWLTCQNTCSLLAGNYYNSCHRFYTGGGPIGPAGPNPPLKPRYETQWAPVSRLWPSPVVPVTIPVPPPHLKPPVDPDTGLPNCLPQYINCISQQLHSRAFCEAQLALCYAMMYS